MKPGTHEHTDCPLTSLHWLFGPHGDGLQGLVITGAVYDIKVTFKGIHSGIYNITWNRSTANERVSSKTRCTRTHWNMINHLALSVLTACTRTRINTLISNTCFIPRTVVAKNAFWSTSIIWVSLVFWQASANAIVALSIRSTW